MSHLVNQTTYQDIAGVVWGWAWDVNAADGHTHLTYAFPTSPADYQGYAGLVGFEPFNAQQQAAAHRALAMYDAVCNVDFTFTTTGAGANIRLAEANSISIGGGIGDVSITHAFGCAPDWFYASPAAHGDTWFNHVDYNAPVLGGFSFAAGLMHEIGHALGLKHGHAAQPVWAADGSVIYNNPALAADHDSLEYSVMTYRAYPGAPIDFVHAVEFPSTPMQDDIIALQYIYGPNYDYNSGNTVYTWSPTTGETFINGVGQGATFHHKIFMTVWDGGGVDTYVFSNYTTNVVIDLAPGAWSTPSPAQRADLELMHPGTHFARGCIANAQVFLNDFHGYIENAAGGHGNDRIYGNLLTNALSGLWGNDRIFGLAGTDALFGGDGNDLLSGGPGSDTLNGGRNRDVFVFNSALDPTSNVDSITDFSVPSDTIRLDNAVFRALTHTGTLPAAFFCKGAAAHDRGDHVIYNPSNGWLIYDANGNRPLGDTHFATLARHLALTHADFIVI